MMTSPLADYLPDADYSFSMRMRPVDAAGFFEPSPEADAVLAERARWLTEERDRVVAVGPNAERLAGPLMRFAEAMGVSNLPATDRTLTELLVQLGRSWEPDFLLLSPGPTGRWTLQAGCVCFPSSWALEEKLGLTVDAIHEIVPGLNSAIGSKIHQFLSGLKPASGWSRSNWGISGSAELNQHPARAVNRLSRDTMPATTWLRIEHQLLTRLPDAEVIFFGIRLQNVSLADVRKDAVISRNLGRALASMPEEMVRYKNLAEVRSALVAFLRS